MSRRWSFLIAAILLFLPGACAKRGPVGPVVPVEPSVEVTQLDPTLITPEVIKFQAKIVITNRMRSRLTIEKVDYGADVQDSPVITETFSELHPMKPRGKQTVTFPFQIAMKDIKDRAIGVLAEEALRIGFRGQVFPDGFGPVSFAATRTFPLPRVPQVSLAGVKGSPAGRRFTVLLRVRNTNTFPLAINSLDSHVTINGVRYGLLQSEESAEIGPGAAETIALTMEHTKGKALSLALNVLQSKTVRYSVGGSVSCRTPYGRVYLPFELQGEVN